MNYVTADVLRGRLDAVRGTPEKYQETIHALGEMLGDGIIRTAWEYPDLERIEIICNPELNAGTKAFCQKHNPRPETLKIELLKKALRWRSGQRRKRRFLN